MKRSICNRCLYPNVTCVCDAITEQTLLFNVVIFQHPKETKHAKNTARLAKLVAPNINIIQTDDDDEIKLFDDSLNKETSIVLFPNENSRSLEMSIKEKSINTENSLFETLILIDGSWKQAYGIWKSMHILHDLRSYHFSSPPEQQYSIRQTKKPQQISTLEAIAYTAKLRGFDGSEHFYKVLSKLKSYWSTYQ